MDKRIFFIIASVAACNLFKKVEADAAPSASAPVASPSSAHAEPDKCVVATTHGSRIGMGDTERATIAAAGSDAMVAIVEKWVDPVGGEGTNTVRAVLGSTFPKVKFDAAPAMAGGEGSGSVGAALAFGGKAYTITFGNGGNGGWAKSQRFMLAAAGVKTGTNLVANHSSGRVAAAGRDDFAVAVTTGQETNGTDPNTAGGKWVKSEGVRSFVWDGKTAQSAVLWETTNKADAPNAVSVAVGPTQAAAVVRTGKKLIVMRIGAKGERLGDPQELATGEVGSPTSVFRGNDLVVVWAQAAVKGSPYMLRTATWDPSKGNPPPQQTLDTGGGGLSGGTFSPSLAVYKGHTLLAWMVGDDSKVGSVYLSMLDDPTKLPYIAKVVSHEGSNARDPRIAANDAGAWMIWSEFSNAIPKGDLRGSRITCAPNAQSLAGPADAPIVTSAKPTASAAPTGPKKCETHLDCSSNEECNDKGTCDVKCPTGKVWVNDTCGAPCADNPDYGKPCPKGFSCMLTSNIAGGCVKDVD